MLFVNKEPGLLSGVPGSLRRSNDMRVCEIDGCDSKHSRRGYCNRHYISWRKYGSPLFSDERRILIKQKLCGFKGCERSYNAQGYCELHYKRSRKGIDLNAPIKVSEKHNMSKTREYNSWATMMQRCHNPKNTNYHKYGARGIKVCQRWRDSFMAFYEDMGERPDGMTLDRKNNSKGYTKENCRWSTVSVQNVNRRTYKSASGVTGVQRHGLKWRAWFKQQIIGSFDTKHEASEAYQRAKSEYLRN